jgi:purine-binding chemotaxis protein CheW
MKNHNDEALKNYFDSMLHDTIQAPVDKEVKLKDKVVEIASLPAELVFAESSTERHIELDKEIALKEEVEVKEDDSAVIIEEWENINVEDEFQVLFFELNNVTFAVPLVDLGGIYDLDDSLNFLMGKPKWFSGVMKSHERLYNIVDTSLWAQLGNSAENLKYTHYVVLGDTSWGLSCENLLGTENLKKDQVRWRDKKGTRPWLAGMVKKKMCALIHAEELVKLLNQGMDIHG